MRCLNVFARFCFIILLILVARSAMAITPHSIVLSKSEITKGRSEAKKLRKKYRVKDQATLEALQLPIVEYQMSVDKISQKLIETAKSMDSSYNYDIHVVRSPAINAYTDGNFIVISTAAINFADNDDELALIIAHELAHNLLHHNEKLFKIATGNDDVKHNKLHRLEELREAEYEADYLALQIMASSGFGIERAMMLWNKMAVQVPATDIDSANLTHPTSTMRYIKSAKAIAIIRDRMANSEDIFQE